MSDLTVITNSSDPRPLPLILAEKYGYDQSYIQRADGSYVYSLEDALAAGVDPKFARNYVKNWQRNSKVLEKKLSRFLRTSNVLENWYETVEANAAAGITQKVMVNDVTLYWILSLVNESKRLGAAEFSTYIKNGA